MKVLGIIPARGGSKGVVRKNIRQVAGQPLIAWTIQAAQKSVHITNFYVSTDDEEISELAKEHGAEVLLRPGSLALDKSPMIPAIQHACNQAESVHGKFDYIVLLQPTAPQRTATDIDAALKILDENNKIDSVISVYLVEDAHPSRMYTLEDGSLVKYAQEPKGSLRQDLADVYHRNGAIYACHRDILMNKGLLIGENTAPYIMPKDRSGNIDDITDLYVTDLLLRMQYNK